MADMEWEGEKDWEVEAVDEEEGRGESVMVGGAEGVEGTLGDLSVEGLAALLKVVLGDFDPAPLPEEAVIVPVPEEQREEDMVTEEVGVGPPRVKLSEAVRECVGEVVMDTVRVVEKEGEGVLVALKLTLPVEVAHRVPHPTHPLLSVAFAVAVEDPLPPVDTEGLRVEDTEKDTEELTDTDLDTPPDTVPLVESEGEREEDMEMEAVRDTPGDLDVVLSGEVVGGSGRVFELQGLTELDRVGDRVTHEEGDREGDLEWVRVTLPHALPLGVTDSELLSVRVGVSVPLPLPPLPAPAEADINGVEERVAEVHLDTVVPPEVLRVMDGEGVVEGEEVGVLPPPPPPPPTVVPVTVVVGSGDPVGLKVATLAGEKVAVPRAEVLGQADTEGEALITPDPVAARIPVPVTVPREADREGEGDRVVERLVVPVVEAQGEGEGEGLLLRPKL